MRENSKQDIISLIDEKYIHMSKSHRKIAAFIKEHYDQAVFMTAAKIGNVLEISESTVVRFASGLGFDGYPDFQKQLAAWVKDKLNAVSKMGVKYGQSSQSELLTTVLRGDMEKINDTIEQVDPNAFETAVDSIIEAKTVYIVGIRSCEPLADFLCFSPPARKAAAHLLTCVGAISHRSCHHMRKFVPVLLPGEK